MIQNLLFDLGGVILDIDRLKAVEALRAAGMRSPEELLGDYGQKGPFLALERGEITPATFRDELRTYFDRPVDDETIDSAFCEFLRGIPQHRLRALEELHRRFKLYLLSNTNALMWDRYILPEFTKAGHDINYYFDGIIASFQVKAYKPEPAIFRAAESILGIDPEETLFFDDSQANVEAARRLGFHAALVTPETDFITIISKQLPK
ncbi:MAG: HAD family phosphatase [Bacteroidales bacterium]|nr:HAD family phosphatase [Bacteroidales bacterium]